jgi:methionine biosynthesis protein MetW
MSVRADHQVIAGLVPQGARVLDVGCGNGELMRLLATARAARVRGLELSHEGVQAAMAQGLAVVQGDADRDLSAYPADAFDVAIASKTLQEMRHPRDVLEQLARLAPRLIISFRNYGHWAMRLRLLLTGRVPAKRGRAWYAAETLHICALADMADLCAELGLEVESVTRLSGGRVRGQGTRAGWLANALAEEAILAVRRRHS